MLGSCYNYELVPEMVQKVYDGLYKKGVYPPDAVKTGCKVCGLIETGYVFEDLLRLMSVAVCEDGDETDTTFSVTSLLVYADDIGVESVVAECLEYIVRIVECDRRMKKLLQVVMRHGITEEMTANVFELLDVLGGYGVRMIGESCYVYDKSRSMHE